MYYIGIDPGLKGALVSISPEGKEPFHLMFRDMPTLSITKTKNEYDVAAIKEIISNLPKNSIIILEKMQSLPPGFKIQATYSLAYCMGLFEGLLLAYGIKYFLVKPKDWQKHFGITKAKGDKKVQSYEIASKLFPKAELATSRGRKLDGRSDALLMAEFARNKFSGECV